MNAFHRKYRELFLFHPRAICYQYHDGMCKCWRETRETLTDDLVDKHLSGQITIGTIPFFDNRFLFADIDYNLSPEELADIRETCTAHGLHPHFETTTKGWHVWFFFDETIPADYLTALASWFMSIGRSCVDLYVPMRRIWVKDDWCHTVSLLALPLGTHTRTRRKACWVTSDGIPVKDQLDYFLSIKPQPFPYQLAALTRGLTDYDELFARVKRSGRIYDSADICKIPPRFDRRSTDRGITCYEVVIRPGESLYSLFGNFWPAVYYMRANFDFSIQRPNPHAVQVGDKVRFPVGLEV